jgi:hypothetical protein
MRAFTDAQVVLAAADSGLSSIDTSSELAIDRSLNKLLERNRRRLAALLRLVWHGSGRRLLKRAVAHRPAEAAASPSSPSPQSKSAVADFDHSIDRPKPAYTRFRLGEGRGAGGHGADVPDTPPPCPSPHGGGEKNARHAPCNRPAARPLTRADCRPQPLRSWDNAPGGEGTVAFWRSKAKEAKARWAAGAADRAAAQQAETPKMSYREAARRIIELLKLDEDVLRSASAAVACRPP